MILGLTRRADALRLGGPVKQGNDNIGWAQSGIEHQIF
jgi:hypothetical protein